MNEELHNVMERALEFGYHRNKCIVMKEMAGPTPITSDCDCGWQDFANELNERLKKDSKPELPPLEIGNVARKNNGPYGKYLIRTEEELVLAIEEKHEFVCAKPHEDGDFSYLCNGHYCRCCS